MTSAWHSVRAYLGLRETDVVGLALPPVYSYGLHNLLMGPRLGATVVLERQAAFPIKLAETLARERVTVFPGGADVVRGAAGGARLGALRLEQRCGCSPTPRPHCPRRTSSGLQGAAGRSCTDVRAGPNANVRATCPPERLERRPGSVGRRHAGTRNTGWSTTKAGDCRTVRPASWWCAGPRDARLALGSARQKPRCGQADRWRTRAPHR